jgi:hypothetical protein
MTQEELKNEERRQKLNRSFCALIFLILLRLGVVRLLR